MSYASQDDFSRRFGLAESIALTDAEGLGVVDAAVLAQALEDASSLVDGYVGGRYSTPLSVVPAMVINITCDLARFALYRTEASEAVKLRYDRALSLLKDISASRLDLPANAAGKAQPTESNTIQFGSQGGNAFGRGAFPGGAALDGLGDLPAGN